MDKPMNQGEMARSFNGQEVNLEPLFELLKHREINYAVFAVSRIETIAALIGSDMTSKKLIPELQNILQRVEDPEINHLLQKSLKTLKKQINQV